MARPPITLRSRLTVRLVVTAAVATLAAGALAPAAASAAPAKAKPKPKATQHHASGRYLALGDSVPFGYTPPQTTPAAQYANAANFISYPQDVAHQLGLKLTNATCPGETTTSFLYAGAQSNGCESAPGGGPGYRTAYPLHASYSGTQISYALNYLKAHQDTSLVSLQIGANDAFLCQETTTDNCAAESGTVFQNITNGVATILRLLRTKAHYTGAIALVSYYSTDYRDAYQSALTQQLDEAVTEPAQAYKATVVNGFGAFQTYAAYDGGNTCGEGLLVKLPDGTCNVHPTPFGHLVLADAVDASVHGVVGRELAGKA